jgi:hypothetical protein
VVAALVLLGAGVGIGALIWSGDSGTTRTIAVDPQSNEAPGDETNTDAGDEQTALANGDARINIQVHFAGLPSGGATFATKQGQPTSCTKDETYAWWPVKDGGTQPIGMTVKFDGNSCRPQIKHENTFDASVTSSAGTGTGSLYVLVTPDPRSAGKPPIKAPQCRGWGNGWTCSAGKPTALDPEFTITAPK